MVEKFKKVKDDLDLPEDAEIDFKEELEKAIEELENRQPLDKAKLPSQTTGLSNDAKESQVQTRRQQQQQISVEAQTAPTVSNPHEKWNAWDVENLQGLWDIAGSENLGKAFEGVPFLDQDVRFTPNFLPDIPEGQAAVSLSDRLLNSKRIPVAQVLVIQDTKTGEFRSILLDIKDYEQVVAKLMKDEPSNFKAAVFDVRPQKGSLVLRSTAAGHGTPWSDEQMKAIANKLVKIKVFNRQVNFYNRVEVEQLKKWISENPEFQKYYESKILTPEMQEAYVSSTIAKIFAGKV